MSSISHVSDTAIWMAYYRALETKRPDALFKDPLAEILTRERGPQIREAMKSTERYSSWSLVMRTRIIDELIIRCANEGCTTVVNLGAGLDTRPYRLELAKGVQWIEVDFPAVVDMKNNLLSHEKAKCELQRIGLDLADRTARQKLFAELNAQNRQAIVLSEGVIPYLTEQMVAELAADLKASGSIKFWIAEYYAESLYPRFQAPSFTKLLGNAPFRFYPKDWFGFFAQAGWIPKEKRYLFDEGEKLRRPFPLPWWANIIKAMANRDKFAERMRMQAYVLYEKSL
jgi:methyltransferase (TIGR00027 family)